MNYKDKCTKGDQVTMSDTQREIERLKKANERLRSLKGYLDAFYSKPKNQQAEILAPHYQEFKKQNSH